MATHDAPELLGQWKSAGAPHTLFFGVGGELIRKDGPDQLAMLTWKVEGEHLLVDQPSAPRVDRLPMQLASSATLRLGDDWYVRALEPDRSLERLALIAGAAWYAAENCHPSGAPFIPFLFIERGHQRRLERLVVSSAREADERAFARAGEERGARVVWARDGRVRTPAPHDAVMIDSFDPDGEHVRYAALYRWHGGRAQVTNFLPVPVENMTFR